MKNNRYLFIIWNRALFCKDKIINDLKHSFVIKNSFYMNWSKDCFEKNLKAFYGEKASNLKEKISSIGTGEFLVLIIEDDNPDYRIEGNETINQHVYDKKWLYRKWTGGDFRIHGTLNGFETEHDLCVLLGFDFDVENNKETINLDTKSVRGFAKLDELRNDFNCFGRNVIKEKDNRLLVLCDCRLNFNYFIGNNNTSENSIKINDTVYTVNVFGTRDGDIPEGFIDYVLNNNECSDEMFDVANSLSKTIDNGDSIDDSVYEFFRKNGFEYSLSRNIVMRPDIKYSLSKKIKNFIKYQVSRIRCLLGA